MRGGGAGGSIAGSGYAARIVKGGQIGSALLPPYPAATAGGRSLASSSSPRPSQNAATRATTSFGWTRTTRTARCSRRTMTTPWSSGSTGNPKSSPCFAIPLLGLSSYEFAVEVSVRSFGNDVQTNNKRRVSTREVWPWEHVVRHIDRDLRAYKKRVDEMGERSPIKQRVQQLGLHPSARVHRAPHGER